MANATRLALIVALLSVAAASGYGTRASSAAGSASLSVAVELDSTRVTTGGELTGLLTVTNHTGRPIVFGVNPPFFQVLLVNRSVRPAPGWLLGARLASIPTGISSYPVVVAASYNGCSNPPTASSPACTPSGGIPRLPPGSYEAVTYLMAPVVPTPPPIRVVVEPN